MLTASCSRANSRRRSPGRWKRRSNSGSWNQPLKFSTLPLNCGSPSGMNTGLTPKRRHRRITRTGCVPTGPQPASSRALSNWTCSGRPRSFQHSPRNHEDLVHAAGVGQAQADGAVEGILADPDVVAVAAALEVDRPHQIDLVQFVGGPGLRAGPLLARQQRGQADPRRGQAVALQDALDGALAGQRADAEGLEFGEDGRGPDQAVAGGRRGVGLEPAADGEDGPLQFGRDALGDVVVGPGQVVEAVGPGLQVAAPPLVEPGLRCGPGSSRCA